MPDYKKLNAISLKNHPELNERWVQDCIAADPTILGLGDVFLRDRERIHSRAGRLDLLLQSADVEAKQRYEVEIQLGRVDESHIIRTIEYWDLERKRNPSFDHVAVIVAEEVTNRFLNVISLFNGHIPLIALKMTAVELPGGGVSLLFTTVLNVSRIEYEDEDDEGQYVATDRAYWERKSTPTTLGMADQMLAILRKVNPKFELRYNKNYIGISENGLARNAVTMTPQKAGLRLRFRIEQSSETEEMARTAGLDMRDYSPRGGGTYRFTLAPGEVERNNETLSKLATMAYSEE